VTPEDRFEREGLARLPVSRRELVRRLVTGTAFALPVVASYDMASLGVPTADAYFANQPPRASSFPPGFSGPDAATFEAGQPGSVTIVAQGPPAPTLSLSGGTPPAGVTFAPGSDGSGTLAGTPGVDSGGLYTLEITAANGVPPDAVEDFSLTVEQAVAITSAPEATFTVASPGEVPLSAEGYPPPSLSLGGSLPAGLSFSDGGDGTGILAGTPAPGSGGEYALEFTAGNEIAAPVSQPLTVTVLEPAAVTSPSQVAATIGAPLTFTVTTTGFPAPALTLAGQLPAGLNFADSGNGTGILSGTPGGTAGAYPLTLTAASPGTAPVSETLTLYLTTETVPSITVTSPTPYGSYGYGAVVTAQYSATSPLGAVSLQGSVPPGGRLDTTRIGSHTLSVTATDPDGLSTTVSVPYTVRAPSNAFTVGALEVRPDGAVALRLEVPGPGRLDVLIRAWDAHLAHDASVLEAAPGRFLLARAQERVRHSGEVRLEVVPTARARRVLHHPRYRPVLRVEITFTPTGGVPRSLSRYGLTIPRRRR
jgi:hypothetical protein